MQKNCKHQNWKGNYLLMDGLIVKEPFATQLVSGEKKFEYRKKPLPKNKIGQMILILNKGKVKGFVVFSGQIHDKKNNIYHYIVSGSTQFYDGATYKHKNGCVIWINDVEVNTDMMKANEPRMRKLPNGLYYINTDDDKFR